MSDEGGGTKKKWKTEAKSVGGKAKNEENKEKKRRKKTERTGKEVGQN